MSRSAIEFTFVTLFEIRLQLTVTAIRCQLAIGRARAVGARVSTIVTDFAVHRIDSGIAATRRQERTTGTAAVVAAVIDAVVANFTQPSLNDVVTAVRTFAAVRTVIIIDFVAVVTLFTVFQNAVTTTSQAAVAQAFRSGRAILSFAVIALFIFLNDAVTTIDVHTILAPICHLVAAFVTFDNAVAAVRFDLTIHATVFDGILIIDMTTAKVARFFVTH